MFDPIPLMLLLVGAGVVLLIGELLLPTHGLLGLIGLASLLGAVALCFYINRWLGLAVFLGAILLTPLVWTAMISVWLRTPVGKRVVLPTIESQRGPVTVRLGDVGVAVTEMRPIGECDFGQQRLEAISERGIIPAGKPVRIVALSEGRPVVRLDLADSKSTV